MDYIKREKITGFSILAGTLIMNLYVIPYHIEITEKYQLASLSPAFFPRLAAWIIFCLSLLHILFTFLHGKRRTPAGEYTKWLSPGEERKAYLSALLIISNRPAE